MYSTALVLTCNSSPGRPTLNSCACRWRQQWPDHFQHQPDGLPRPARLAALHPEDSTQRRRALRLPHRRARWQGHHHRGGWLGRCQSEEGEMNVSAEMNQRVKPEDVVSHLKARRYQILSAHNGVVTHLNWFYWAQLICMHLVMLRSESPDLNSIIFSHAFLSPISYCRNSFPRRLSVPSAAHVRLYSVSVGYRACLVSRGLLHISCSDLGLNFHPCVLQITAYNRRTFETARHNLVINIMATEGKKCQCGSSEPTEIRLSNFPD